MSLQHLLRVNLPVDLVLRLLQLAPNIVVVQGNFGNLPLHIHSMWIWRLSHHNHIVTGGVPRGCAGAELLFTVTALDVTLYSGSSPSVVEMLLETWGIPTGCASTRSSWTASPHNSVRYKNSLKIYTDKVTSGQPRPPKLCDDNGYLPLHYACDWGGSLALIDMILLAYPQGIAVKDKWGRPVPSAFFEK